MQKVFPYAFIFVAAGLLFFSFLGHVHLFDWDEINFAECAREMIVSKDYLRAQIDFMPFWEKPPFFIWMQVLSMKIFGVGEFAARFPNALTGVITLVSVYYIGKRVHNEKIAFWWSLLFAASWLPHIYFKSGIIDPVFNLFIFAAFYQIWTLKSTKQPTLHAAAAGLLLGMAVLTKGPVAILIAVISLVAYLVINRGLNGYKVKHLFLVALTASIPMLFWMAAAVASHGIAYGKWFMSEFVTYQIRLFSTEDADHGGPFFYHFIVLLIGCFPASIFLFQYIGKRNTGQPKTNDFTRWMWILFWVVLILFSIVKTKIVHYSSLCYFPLTYLAALQLARLSYDPRKFKKSVKVLLLSIGTIVSILIGALPLVGLYKQKLIPYIEDPFAVGNLAADIPWSGIECCWGVLYLAGIWISAMYMRKNFRNGMIALCVCQIIIIQVAVIHFTPKVEGYTQRAAIEYFQGFAGKDVYVKPLDYMSYAHLFYSNKSATANQNYYSYKHNNKGEATSPEANEGWLMTGNIDKPAYFICKIQDKKKFLAMPQLEQIGEKNGFAFFKRK